MPLSTAPAVYVVVVESHQHALEHIHFMLRRKKIFSDWSMLHFDAHPDLAVPHPNVPAIACFQPHRPLAPTRKTDKDDATNATPKNLYEMLDDTASGIAEWILPLALAAGLEQIQWIRPAQSRLSQLPVGQNRYRVGAWIPHDTRSRKILSFLDLPESAPVKVDWPCPYYMDDFSCVPTDELALPQLVNLEVSEAIDCNQQDSMCSSWELDICLDYFCCRNPFLSGLEELNKELAKAFGNAVYSSLLYKSYATSDPLNLASFREQLASVLRNAEDPLYDATASFELLQSYYLSRQEGISTLKFLLESLPNKPSDRRQQIDAALEVLPHITMPHDAKESLKMAIIRPRLEAARNRIPKSSSTSPFLVTVARSTDDGFTPANLVEELQNAILSMLHDIYCGCSRKPRTETALTVSSACRLRILLDYGPWEGSTLETIYRL
jgi:hypothetical protein